MPILHTRTYTSIGCNFIQCRLETKLKKKGKKAGVKWDSTNVDYLRTLKTAQEKLRLQILETLQQTTAERLFLLDLMKKYAS
ncbi:hypothetical protein DPMN_110166 [Dreissena polymorpha]|uniref:Uncharacterized protein n=1 Tax=Dreissena polymorpha TaxID=45954 RepID=A0A9D4QMP3_DREPO|nr:hypothetical protein DPMN_110166 [Dreissena polymorpha]